MVELRIHDVEFLGRGYRIPWSADGSESLFTGIPLEISYDFVPPPDIFYPVNNLLAAILPVLAKECQQVRITSPFAWDDRLKAYWCRVLASLGIQPFTIEWNTAGSSGRELCPPGRDLTQGRIALLFGGGVESMFALSVLHGCRPILVSIVGDQWMNNDIHTYSIKRDLEDRLVSRFNLDFQRVRSNGMSLIRKAETYKNHYVSGLLFYWHSLPLCRQFGVSMIYKASEMEEALNFDDMDLSLHPSFLRNIVLEGEPLLLPLFNCYPKIRMFEGLSKTPFFEYIYSCLHNTDRRWCGLCSKCYRISEYCDRLGIDPSVIGMQAGIIGLRERGPITRHYWALLDQLYGKRPLRHAMHAAKVYHSRALRKIRRWLGTEMGRRAGSRL